MVLGLLAAPTDHQVLQVLAGQRSAVLPQQRQHLLGWQRPPLQSSTSPPLEEGEWQMSVPWCSGCGFPLPTTVYSKLVGLLT